jgi:hypothetical protein
MGNSKTPFICPPKKQDLKKKSTPRGTPEYHSSLPSLCMERIIELFFQLIVQIFENTCRHAENVKQNSQAQYSFII